MRAAAEEAGPRRLVQKMGIYLFHPLDQFDQDYALVINILLVLTVAVLLYLILISDAE